MNYQEKLQHYASAKRITVQVIHQFEGGDFVRYFCGKLRGKIVSTNNGYKFKTKQDAWQNAFNFRADCIAELNRDREKVA